MNLIWSAVFIVSLLLVLLRLWRRFDHSADRRAMKRLLAEQAQETSVFDPEMVSDLPEPVRRYFGYTITVGAPLKHAAQIRMAGKFGLGDRSEPKYMEMSAEQVLVAPTGFVWKMKARSGLMVMSGSDTEHWTRFWLAGLIPIARIGGTLDHFRSAFGRLVAEAVFWTPAALLPSEHIRWAVIDHNNVQVTFRCGEVEQSVDILLDREGKPIQVSFLRWSNANSEGKFRLQPFGGYLSEFREFDGFKLPTHVEAGNNFGTPDYFPFFIVDVSSISFSGRYHD